MSAAWSKSGDTQLDQNGDPAGGALAYFYVGGTTTPLVTYEDSGETTPLTNPVEAAADGTWPLVFIPFLDTYDVKVTTAGGTQRYYHRFIPNPDPVDVAAGAVTTSSTQILQTGDWLFNPKSGVRSGFVRANGRTIGSAASGASERANADCADLYAYLYDNFADGILPVSGGRGASAASDFALNKPIALFDIRAGSPFGLDDMGNTAASRLGSWPFSTGNATTGGSFGGENAHALSTGELATHLHGFGTIAAANESSHTHGGTTGVQSADHTHGVGTFVIGNESAHTHTYSSTAGTFTLGGASGGTTSTGSGSTTGAGSAHTHGMTGSSAIQSADHFHSFTTGAGAAHTHTISGSTANAGSGTAHNIVSIGVLGNWLIKL